MMRTLKHYYLKGFAVSHFHWFMFILCNGTRGFQHSFARSEGTEHGWQGPVCRSALQIWNTVACLGRNRKYVLVLTSDEWRVNCLAHGSSYGISWRYSYILVNSKLHCVYVQSMRFQLVRTANEIPRRSVRISQSVILTGCWQMLGADLGLAKS